MGKYDPMALYHSVMGEAWADDNKKARAAAAAAHARQPRGGVRGGNPSSRNMIRAATGARPAIFKRINNGGCKTRKSLSNQLDYVNDKAVFTYSTINRELTDSPVLSEGQKQTIIDHWSHSWRGSTKLGYTSHMLLSFPEDVTIEQVRDIALDWTEHFFDDGLYGDVWDYTVSVHDDRENNHAHILLNNRGLDSGQWFSMYGDSPFSPQLMREKQAEIAEQYGVELTATTRLERGIFAKPAGVEEIYAAKAQGRRPEELALTEQEQAIAEAAVLEFAKEYRSLADKLDKTDQAYLAGPLRKMAEKLLDGEGAEKTEPLKREDIKTVEDAALYAEQSIERIFAKANSLPSAERPAFEIKAGPAIAKLCEYAPNMQRLAAFSAAPIANYPMGAEAKPIDERIDTAHDRASFNESIAYGKENGIDTVEAVARMEAGGTSNPGVAARWIERDLKAIMEHSSKEGLAIERKEALNVLGIFQTKLCQSLGVELSKTSDMAGDLQQGRSNENQTSQEKTLDLDDDMEM